MNPSGIKFILIAGAFLSGWAFAQDVPNPPSSNSAPQTQPAPAQDSATQQAPQTTQGSTKPAQTGQQRRIAPGSVIPVQLSKGVDAKKAKIGDEVDAKVTQDMKSVNGELLIAKDTKVVGHVTEAQARSKEQKESQIGIAFDSAVMKDGAVSSLPMSIQAVIAPQNPNNPNSDSSASSGGGAASSDPASGSSGRSGNMSGRAPQGSPSDVGGAQPSGDTTSNTRPPITANTQGVIGISNYELSTSGDEAHGSVVHSEKGNVKLESGTLLLLKVNQ
jgi:hypothetical protein